ncbi:hypothetical protein H6P81_009773 [Aristolochia fimbriata]|uniref:Uncharacterized protein n=1 Tax=Aristolochia fimbriata TaxID=158543 RepID=A0AAV7ERB7_ARIFI|nr:hypothetical protein H6P81_009773 [Aristolochia fimbriata]
MSYRSRARRRKEPQTKLRGDTDEVAIDVATMSSGQGVSERRNQVTQSHEERNHVVTWRSHAGVAEQATQKAANDDVQRKSRNEGCATEVA